MSFSSCRYKTDQWELRREQGRESDSRLTEYRKVTAEKSSASASHPGPRSRWRVQEKRGGWSIWRSRTFLQCWAVSSLWVQRWFRGREQSWSRCRGRWQWLCDDDLSSDLSLQWFRFQWRLQRDHSSTEQLTFCCCWTKSLCIHHHQLLQPRY